MKVEDFIKILGVEFFTGVPDSQLKALCNYLMEEYGICDKHIIAANEGNCTALAAGYYLATGKIPLVYMQNSGEGNIINPVASLMNDNVYAIPCVFVIGWRGEPGIHDEPQHIYQGKVTLRLLKDMDIDLVISAGFDKPLGVVSTQFRKRIIGVYPALVPAFTDGVEDPVRAALERGCKVSGATAYFADIDGRIGPIIAQQSVEVRADDSAETLSKRILEEAEWKLLPRAVALFCQNKLEIHGDRVVIKA